MTSESELPASTDRQPAVTIEPPSSGDTVDAKWSLQAAGKTLSGSPPPPGTPSSSQLASELRNLRVEEEAVDAKPPGRDLSDAVPVSRFEEPGADGEPRPVLTDRDSPYYDIQGPKRVIIFNHKKFQSRFQLNERKGTELDVNAIKGTFKALNWSIDVYNDPKITDIRSVFTSLQVSGETENLSALAVFILSHGEDNGTVFAQDAMYRVDHDILFQLTADKCPYLAGKPKLIFVQACQGQNTDPGVNLRRRHTSQDSTATYKIPNFADFLIFQAAFWNHYSFRSSDTGSWFIQALCRKIMESDEHESLMDTLLAVSRTVSVEKESNVPTKPHLHQKKQTPLLYSTLLRRLYLKEPPQPAKAVNPASRHSLRSALSNQGPRTEQLDNNPRQNSKDSCRLQ